MKQVSIKDIKKGEFFTLSNHGEYPNENRVYIKGDYDRAERKYECSKFTDMNHCSYLKADRKVWIGFTF